jgi:hypothetical protein
MSRTICPKYTTPHSTLFYNPGINIHRLYKPLIQAALRDWKDKDIFTGAG